jgi:hypothetical protein
MYWQHRDEPCSKAMPYLLLSGILEIREHCMAMVSESRYLAALAFMRSDIPALLSDATLWVRSGSGSLSAERKLKIKERLDEMERHMNAAWLRM